MPFITKKQTCPLCKGKGIIIVRSEKGGEPTISLCPKCHGDRYIQHLEFKRSPQRTYFPKPKVKLPPPVRRPTGGRLSRSGVLLPHPESRKQPAWPPTPPLPKHEETAQRSPELPKIDPVTPMEDTDSIGGGVQSEDIEAAGINFDLEDFMNSELTIESPPYQIHGAQVSLEIQNDEGLPLDRLQTEPIPELAPLPNPQVPEVPGFKLHDIGLNSTSYEGRVQPADPFLNIPLDPNSDDITPYPF